MRRYALKGIFALVVALAALNAVAQDQPTFATVLVAESEEYGAYLTDDEGMSLYLFVDDVSSLSAEMGLEPMAEGIRPEAAQCVDDCLSNWPPLLADDAGPGEAEEAKGTLDAELLYVADVDGRQQVVYNGWPLYYFANDTEAGDVNGHGAGDRWFLVSPEGHVPGEGDEGMAGPEAPEDDPDQPSDEADSEQPGEVGAGEDGEAETGEDGDTADDVDEEDGDEGRASPDAPEDDPDQPSDTAE